MGGLRLVGRRVALALAACALVCLVPASAAAGSAPSADARAWIVENPATGQVLDSHDADGRFPIASITKLMTLIVALGQLKLDQVVSVDPRAAEVGQESIYLDPYQQISVSDLVKGALIQSANDAADALALATSSSFSAFAELMNAKARELGLSESHFVRPDGLDAPGEYASARDVLKMALVAMRIPAVVAAVRMQTATLADGEVLHTWNDLLGVFPGVFGVKTGHTSAAGWCQVVAARNAEGTTIYVVILGSPARAQIDADLERLLAWGLAQYREVEAVSGGHVYAQAALPYGRGALPLVASGPLALNVRVGAVLRERVVAPASLTLPVRAGAALGRIEIYEGGRMVGERSLLAARGAAAPSLAARIGWYAGRTLHDLAGLLT